jgi:hypothetical protein
VQVLRKGVLRKNKTNENKQKNKRKTINKMKSTIELETKNKRPQKYPALKQSIEGLVVMFVSKGKGMVVNSGDHSEIFPLGFSCDDWNEDWFEEFDGSVTLSNS